MLLRDLENSNWFATNVKIIGNDFCEGGYRI